MRTRNSCVTIIFKLCQTSWYNENNNPQFYLGVNRCFDLLITITFKAGPEGTLRLKVELTGSWLGWQCYESHVARSVDQTSLTICLFKLNTYCHRQQSPELSYLRNYISRGCNKMEKNEQWELKQHCYTRVTMLVAC